MPVSRFLFFFWESENILLVLKKYNSLNAKLPEAARIVIYLGGPASYSTPAKQMGQ